MTNIGIVLYKQRLNTNAKMPLEKFLIFVALADTDVGIKNVL